MIGDGNLKQYYQEKYTSLVNLTFAPKVQKGQLKEVLRNCDLLFFSVHPSNVWQYGQSLNKLIDYMMAGKPVLASYTGYQSMLNEANSGVFVPAGNLLALNSEVLKLSKTPERKRIQMGERGLKWLVSERNYRSLANEYSKILFPN